MELDTDPSDDTLDELECFLRVAGRIIVKRPEPASFLDWIAMAGPQLLADMAAAVDPRTGPASQFFRLLGRAVWNMTPLPSHQFRPQPLPKPGRNDVCFCGSGQKYKHCCQSMENFEFPQVNMLKYVLLALPKKQLAQLPQSAASIDALAHAAQEFIDEGHTDLAIAMLEPYFAGEGRIAARLEPLMDTLLNAYLAAGKPRKKVRLLEQAQARGDREIVSSALQRRATIASDAGDFAGAKSFFQQAQRLTPDDPSLALLECLVLSTNGEVEQAKARARFWLARLERMRDPQLAPLIEKLREIARDPAAAFFATTTNIDPAIDALTQSLGALPEPRLHYRIERADDGVGLILADAELEQSEDKWRQVFEQAKPALTSLSAPNPEAWDEPKPWLKLLRDQPILFDSFDVLDDLVIALDAKALPGIGEQLVDPLLLRARHIFDLLLREDDAGASRPETGTLPWVVHGNRPALRLRARLAIELLEKQRTEECCALLQQFVVRLNPNDNHAFRDLLSQLLIDQGRYGDALELGARYGHEGPTLAYNRVLALAGLQRRGEALSAFADARQDYPHIAKALAANKRPRLPADNAFVTMGSSQEAWLYRDAHYALWQRLEVLEFVREVK